MIRKERQIGRVTKTEKSPSDMTSERRRLVSAIGPRIMPMTIGDIEKSSLIRM